MNHYEVTIDWDGSDVTMTIVASTPGKARAEAWRCVSEPYPDLTFGRFLTTCRSVRRVECPDSSGYASVERQYGKRFRVGDRVRLNDGEGSSAGLEGQIVYPGPSTCYAHVAIDGRDYVSAVHPQNVDVVSS